MARAPVGKAEREAVLGGAEQGNEHRGRLCPLPLPLLLRPGRVPQPLSRWRLHSDTPLRSWRVPCLEVTCLGTLRPGV